MEEERPMQDAGKSFDNPEPATMITTDQTGNGRAESSISRLMIVGIVLIISLLVAGLFLPPISLAQRLGFAESAAEESGETAEASGALTLHLSDEAANVEVAVVSGAALADDEETSPMAAAIPEAAELSSNVYLINYEGAAPQGRVSIAMPEDAGPEETLDLYGWDGSAWTFMPLRSTPEDRWESSAGPIPGAVALMQTADPQNVAVGAEALPAQELPASVLPHLTEVTAGMLTLGADGQLNGNVAELAEGGYRQYVLATNVGIVVDQGSLGALLTDEALLAQHVDALLEAAAPFAGLNLDYQGVPAGQREAFTSFVRDLAEALHAEDKELLVTLEAPAFIEGGTWDTAGQDWPAIGQAADAIYVRLPLNPAAYAEDGMAQQLVSWAVTQIHRHKISLLTTTNAVDAVGGAYRELPNTVALANFGELTLTEGAEHVEAGTSVEVGLAGTAGPLEWDGDSNMYRYTYEEAGQQHTVWLGNETAVSHRLNLAQPFHLRGVALRGLSHATEGQGFAAAIESYVNAADAPEPGGAAIVWTVEDEEESVVASSSGEALSYRWDETGEPGSYTISAVFAQGDAVADLGSMAIEVSAVSTPTPTPQPTVTATAEEEEPAQAAAATSTPATVAQLDPGQADAIINIASNFRRGPGLGYSVIEVLQAGTQLALTGRNTASDWLQVQVADGGQEGWLYGELLTINSSVNVDGLEVVEVDPPTVGDDPAPPAPPPISNTGFELGGQTHTLANPTLMREAGMNWVKFQHKWGPGDTPDAVAGRIDHAHGNGFKVLLSIPGGNYPSSIDFNAYVEFLRGVAALGPDAIEIWNEMNIDREWPAGQIDPASYVNNMLRPAYEAIKSVNPNVMVISGAPAPTGADNGTNVWADDRYMAGVAAAGGANYMDCIGVHHNAGATPPSASSGHPAGNNHYSWYFQPTLNMYYNTFGGARPVCFTELGYLSGQDFGGVPGGFSWASGTSVSQHAQWLGEAVSLAGNSGRVRLVIIFNVDFTLYGEDPQAGYAVLRPDGSCPACATLSAAMGQ